MLQGDQLVKVTKILYSQWMKKWGVLFQPKDVRWDDSEDVIEFYQGIHKKLGLDMEIDEFFYYINTLLMNEENLKNGTLDSSNIITPSKKLFQVNVSERRVEIQNYYGHVKMDGYFTKDQLEFNIQELYSEGYVDLRDYTQDDSEYVDGQSEGIDVEGVELVKVLKNESTGFNKFLDSLTESEIKFLKNKLEQRLL